MKKYKSIYVQMGMRFVSCILLLSIPNLDKPEPKRKKIKKLNFLFFLSKPYPPYVAAGSENMLPKHTKNEVVSYYHSVSGKKQ